MAGVKTLADGNTRVFLLATKPADINAITVTEQLRKTGDLQRGGGAEYLHTLTSIVPTAANAAFYADMPVPAANAAAVPPPAIWISGEWPK